MPLYKYCVLGGIVIKALAHWWSVRPLSGRLWD